MRSQYGYGFGYGAGGKAADLYGGRYDRGDSYSPYESGPKEPPSLKRDLSLLPTIQSVSCRTPKCDRNATCMSTARSLETPYGCCSDYMLVMLNDITGWLKQQGIPYFITYGTLLGALRQSDILPWTQDMDIVIDRSHWPKLQQGLEAAEFFGGRRYLFGVDQWEEKVSRVCADWEGFATSIVGGSCAQMQSHIKPASTSHDLRGKKVTASADQPTFTWTSMPVTGGKSLIFTWWIASSLWVSLSWPSVAGTSQRQRGQGRVLKSFMVQSGASQSEHWRALSVGREQPAQHIRRPAVGVLLGLGVGFLACVSGAKAAAVATGVGKPHLGVQLAMKMKASFAIPDWAILMLLSALPLVELRGGVPVGLWMGIKKLLSPLLKRAAQKTEPIGAHDRWVGVAAFVGVPLPGTGAWTGAMVAYLLGMDLPEAELFAESSDEVAGMEWPTRTPHTRTDA
eukprot:g12270.t1